MDARELKPSQSQSISSLAMEIGVTPAALDKVPFYKYADVLYPYKAICIYFFVRTGTYFPDAEKRCNDYLEQFVVQQVATIGVEEYFKRFKTAVTDKVFELIALRALAATYQYGKNKMDYLPEYRREEICRYLKIPLNISCNDAITKLENASRSVNDEEQMLGRIGYLISWKILAGKNYNPTIIDDDKVEIVTNTLKDNRGLPRDRSILKEWGREDTEQDIMEGPVPGVNI